MATWSISVSNALHAYSLSCRRKIVSRSSPTRARSSGSLMPRPSRSAPRRGCRSCPREGCGGPRRRPRPIWSRGKTAESGGTTFAVDDRLVGRPRLAVVGEVRALDGLELHPQVAVVVLDHVAAGRRAGDDRAAALGHEHARAHGRASRVLEDDVGVVADQGADVLAEAAPLGLVLGVLVLPEPVVAARAVDDVLAAQLDATSRPCSALDTTPIGVPPALRTCWTAKEPMPPEAPQISTLSPWVIGAPLRETSMR